MRILLIKPKQIGDSLILTPTITAIKQAYPEAEIWVVVRRGCEGILAGCPHIARILTVQAVEKYERRPGDLWKELETIWQISTHRFDCAFELGDGSRGRNIIRLASAYWCRRRFSVKPGEEPFAELAARKAGCKISSFDWQTCHRVEKDFYTVSEFLPLPGPIPPLCFERSRAQIWEEGRSLTDFCVVQVGSRQEFNRWRREGWRDVCRAMLERFSNVVVSCGPVAHETEEAAWLQQELGPRVVSTRGRTTWPEMAWLLGRAKLYVGPNTAAMHLAAACRCPVVALFGPSIEDHWYPWQAPYRIVTSHGYVPVQDTVERYARVKKRTMNEIEARDVVVACEELLTETGAS
jgi:heptosyltransferase-3